MSFSRNLILSLLSLSLSTLSIDAQVFLQLERPNNPVSVKYNTGDILEYQLVEFPGIWKKHYILDLKADEQLVVLNDQFFNTSDFLYVRRRYPVVRGIGTRLMQFSAVWFAYGGIATLASESYTMSDREILIGAGIAAVGFLMRTVFHKSKVRLGKKKRFRIVDIRMDPERGF